jgi:SOS response regulatory protein OraA/RecX
MSETATQIIDREIRASEAPRLKAIAADRAKAMELLSAADKAEKRLKKQLRCNAAGAHEFETTPGSGMMGDRFEEKCKHCGWIHTC